MDKKRKRQVFASLQEVRAEAATKATQMTNDDLDAAELMNADSAAYLRGTALLNREVSTEIRHRSANSYSRYG